MICGRIIAVLSLVLSPVLTIPAPNQPGANSTGFIQPKILGGANGCLGNVCLTSGQHTLSVGQTVCVVSPGYPDKYDHNANTWLQIESADQESGYLDVWCPTVNIRYSPNCRADYLTIIYSNFNNNYCGTKRPPAHFQTTSRRIWFGFRSDGSRRAKGFYCQVTAKSYRPDPPSCYCGQANTNRIIGGEPSGMNEYPWLVAIVGSGSTIHWCGGSLYNKEWVITAAHCLAQYNDAKAAWIFKDASEWEILLGMHNWKTLDPTPTRRSVSQIIPHGQFGDGVRLNNDIALMKMSSPVTFSNSIQPACLPPSTVDYNGCKSYSTGWGYLGAGRDKPNMPYKVELPIRSHQECEAAHGGYPTDNMICAGTKTISKGVCPGDSGGPMTVEVFGRHYLVGVASFSPPVCGTDPYLSGYTKVANYISFISNNAGAQCP